MICLTSCKTPTTHEVIELLVPLSWNLFQTAQTLLQLTHEAFFVCYHEALRLLHINFFLQIAMKEGYIYI